MTNFGYLAVEKISKLAAAAESDALFGTFLVEGEPIKELTREKSLLLSPPHSLTFDET